MFLDSVTPATEYSTCILCRIHPDCAWSPGGQDHLSSPCRNSLLDELSLEKGHTVSLRDYSSGSWPCSDIVVAGRFTESHTHRKSETFPWDKETTPTRECPCPLIVNPRSHLCHSLCALHS